MVSNKEHPHNELSKEKVELKIGDHVNTPAAQNHEYAETTPKEIKNVPVEPEKPDHHMNHPQYLLID